MTTPFCIFVVSIEGRHALYRFRGEVPAHPVVDGGRDSLAFDFFSFLSSCCVTFSDPHTLEPFSPTHRACAVRAARAPVVLPHVAPRRQSDRQHFSPVQA